MTLLHIPEKDFDKLWSSMSKDVLTGDDLSAILKRVTVIDPEMGLNYGIVSDKKVALTLLKIHDTGIKLVL